MGDGVAADGREETEENYVAVEGGVNPELVKRVQILVPKFFLMKNFSILNLQDTSWSISLAFQTHIISENTLRGWSSSI